MIEQPPRYYVFDGMELLPEPLTKFVEMRLSNAISGHWQSDVKARYHNLRVVAGHINWDQLSLLQVMNMFWDDAFRDVLGRGDRALVNELIDIRNKLAHDEAFSYPDAERALDTMRRLMDAISAGKESQKIAKIRNQILVEYRMYQEGMKPLE